MAEARGEPRREPPSLRALLALAWPIVVARSTQVVVGLCDAAMVAHLGESALAATVTGAMNALNVFILPIGIVLIVSSFSSQLAGRGDRAGARRHGWYGLAVALGAQVLTMGLVPLVPLALGALSYEPELRDSMSSYLAIRLLSGGAAVGLEALGNYYGGLGNTRRPMRAQVAAMVLNVAGNWLLIDGNLGAPRLGVTGAALASSISTTLAFLGLLAIFVAEGRRAPALGSRLRLGELWRMLRFGVPSGLNWFLEFAAFTFFVNVVVAGLGTIPLAALMAVLQINSFSFMPAFGLSSAGAILVGQAIGAGARDEVPRVLRLTWGAAASWQCAVGVVYLLAPELIFSGFARGPDRASAELLLSTGVRMLVLSSAWQLFDASVAALSESLRAAGDTAFTLWARVVIAWLVFIPGSWITVRVLGLGDLAAVGWIVAYIAVLAGVLYLRFRSGAWRRIELLEPAV